MMTTIAGTGSSPDSGDSGLAILANIAVPLNICFDTKGDIYIGEGDLPGFRKIDKNGIITSPIKFNKYILNITINKNGELYLCSDNVMKIDSTGKLSVIAGGGTSTASGIPALQEKFKVVEGMVFDNNKNLYIADLYRIMKIDSNGIITTIAGTYGVYGYSGDDGPAKNALFFSIADIKMDKNRSLYISDAGNSVIRKIDTSGIIRTVIGTGVPGFSGDNDSAINATINQPSGLTFDKYNNLYFTDQSNNRIRKVDTTGIITTYAGSGGYGNMDGPALLATLNVPAGLAFDSANNLYIADEGNNLIRKVTPADLPVTLLSFKVSGFKSFNGNTNTAVSWETATEINVSHFNVQRSEDGVIFETVGTVKAKGTGSYSFTAPPHPEGGIEYFRLEVVDKNGVLSYSEIREISVGSDKKITVFPNPTQGIINVELPISGNWQITATDIEGRVVWEHECSGCSGIIKHNLNTSKGLYFIKIINTTTGQQTVKKITLQ